MMKANGVPAGHDVEGDDAAQRVRHDRHLPVLLKVRVPRAEEGVEPVQLQGQTSSYLHTQAHRQTA